MRKRALALVILALIMLAGTVLTARAAFAGLNAAGSTPIYYAGPPGAVRTALDLAIRDESFTLVDTPTQARVIVLNDQIPDPEAIRAQVAGGTGLLLILGPDLGADEVGQLLGESGLAISAQDDALSLIPASVDDPVLKHIVWESAPQVRGRAELTGSSLEPLVVGFEDGELVLGKGQIRQGPVFVFTPYLSDSSNPQFQDWAYFNYLIYRLVARGAGQTPLDYADYPGAPVPHPGERVVMFAILTGMLIVSGGAFVLVRHYSLAHPEALDELVIDRAEFETRQAQTDWDSIGYHRPLGGFLFALMLGLVLFVPLIIYQNLILPSYILPSAQALGIWGRVAQFFLLFWNIFDMGTSAAFIKFFAQYRVDNPRKAIQFGQVFVWWQALSGAFQVALVVVIAGAGTAAHHLRAVCVEHHRPCHDPDPRLLPGVSARVHGAAALRLRADARPGRAAYLPDDHAADLRAAVCGLGPGQPGVRAGDGRRAGHGRRRVRQRGADLRAGTVVV